jgi:hypothetical protein
MKISTLLCSVALFSSLLATNATWNVDANGNWNLNGNWTPATFPNAVGDTANFFNKITASRTVTLGVPITVGTINFDSANNYLITANTLTMNNGGAPAINLTSVNGSGAHTIASAVTMAAANNLTMTHSSSANFTMSGAIGPAGAFTFTKAGAGTGSLILSANNAFGDATHGAIINAGTLQISANNNL